MRCASLPLALVVVLVAACGGRTSLGTGSSPDPSAPIDSGVATFGLVDIFLEQDCMPLVAPDPVYLDGELVITNTTASAIGPLTVTSGLLVDETNTVVATFSVDADPIGVIPVGDTVTAYFGKIDDSMTPANRCAIGCGKMLRVVLVLSGLGVPSGTRATSSDTPMGCAF